MLLKKYFLTFCTFALGLSTLWVCAQSETTASENTEKTPGEQLIEFLQNLPSKYELEVESRLGTNKTYYKIKRDDSNLFFGYSSDPLFFATNKTDKLSNFHITCNNGNEYWWLNERDLTTWTNKGKKDELESVYVQEILRATNSAKSFFSIIRGLQIASWTDPNHFSITNSQGEITENSSFTRDDEGYILKQTVIFTSPQVSTNENNKGS